MRLNADGTLRLSPSDLANYLACAHLTQVVLGLCLGAATQRFVLQCLRYNGDEMKKRRKKAAPVLCLGPARAGKPALPAALR